MKDNDKTEEIYRKARENGSTNREAILVCNLVAAEIVEVIAEEREACAKIADDADMDGLAALIRARGDE